MQMGVIETSGPPRAGRCAASMFEDCRRAKDGGNSADRSINKL
jgi:hypothetical protein